MTLLGPFMFTRQCGSLVGSRLAVQLRMLNTVVRFLFMVRLLTVQLLKLTVCRVLVDLLCRRWTMLFRTTLNSVRLGWLLKVLWDCRV